MIQILKKNAEIVLLLTNARLALLAKRLKYRVTWDYF